MNLTERGMGIALRGLNRFAGSKVVERMGLREPAERTVYQATKHGFRTIGAVGRTFAATQRRGQAERLAPSQPKGLFDLTPTDEQQMLREAARDFAAGELRPAAQQADFDCAPPDGLLKSSAELGTTMFVPEEVGGAVSERSAVTSVLLAEALATGDMSLAFACLAPAAVSTAIGLWGDADQQSRYLPAFTGDDVPAAALALLEPRPLFDPLELATTAKRSGAGYVLDGVKSLVPLAAAAEVFVVGAKLEGTGPALFIVESKTKGVTIEAEPAMGLRAASTAKLLLKEVEVEPGGLLGDGRSDVYRECVNLGRLGWCALAVGTSQAVLDYVKEYVNQRTAFGEPISHRQSVAFAVSDIATELEGMRLATYRAASLADQGKPFSREVALARRLCVDHGMRIGSQGVQLLGGHGFVKEHPVERWYRDLRAAGVMEGALLV
jgi:alkylation response protein AidB-like acyl-CoA dehydrogenase